MIYISSFDDNVKWVFLRLQVNKQYAQFWWHWIKMMFIPSILSIRCNEIQRCCFFFVSVSYRMWGGKRWKSIGFNLLYVRVHDHGHGSNWINISINKQWLNSSAWALSDTTGLLYGKRKCFHQKWQITGCDVFLWMDVCVCVFGVLEMD